MFFRGVNQFIGQCRGHTVDEQSWQIGDHIPENRADQAVAKPNREHLNRSAGNAMFVYRVGFIVDGAPENSAGAIDTLARERTAQRTGIYQRTLQSDAHGDKPGFDDPAIGKRTTKIGTVQAGNPPRMNPSANAAQSTVNR